MFQKLKNEPFENFRVPITLKGYKLRTTLNVSQIFLYHILIVKKKAKRVKRMKMKPSSFVTIGKKEANTYALHKCICQQFSYPIRHFHMSFHNCNIFI